MPQSDIATDTSATERFGPSAFGRMSKSKIAVGIARVALTLRMSKTVAMQLAAQASSAPLPAEALAKCSGSPPAPNICRR